jgi:hypothetical protein
MPRSSRTSSLANQVAELRKLVEARLAATKPRPCLQIIFDEGTNDAEIERLHAEAAAEAGVDPTSVEWIHCRIVHPKPRNEPPEVLPPGGWQPEIEPPEPEPQKPERAEPTPERLERWKQHVQELERRGIRYDPEGKKRSRPGDGIV